MQAPWCYVGAECKGGTLGSFSRRHDDCALLGTSSPDWNASSAASTEYSGDPSADYPMESQAADGQAQPMMQPRYVAPRGCPCSGVRSALGYGGRCKGWEYEGQAPWCYVHDNCSLASAAGRPGSFGHRYLDCVIADDVADDVAAPSGGRRLHSAGRRLQQTTATAPSTLPATALSAPLAGVATGASFAGSGAFPRRDPDEDALLERVERLKQPHVALVALATEGFVSVEQPPHRLALQPHARTDALSLRGVFSFLPSGGIMSLSTNALLNLCEEPSALAERAEGLIPTTPATPAAAAEQATRAVCTSFAEAGSAHPKLLRSLSDAKGLAAFQVERLERQAAPKPKRAPSIEAKGSRAREGRG